MNGTNLHFPYIPSWCAQNLTFMRITFHFHLVPRLRMSESIPPFPPHVFMACRGITLPFTKTGRITKIEATEILYSKLTT
jgi:hypothetical protein